MIDVGIIVHKYIHQKYINRTFSNQHTLQSFTMITYHRYKAKKDNTTSLVMNSFTLFTHRNLSYMLDKPSFWKIKSVICYSRVSWQWQLQRKLLFHQESSMKYFCDSKMLKVFFVKIRITRSPSVPNRQANPNYRGIHLFL